MTIVVWDIGVASDGRLFCDVRNSSDSRGRSAVVHVYVDEVYQASFGLDALLPASYRNPATTTRLDTDVRLAAMPNPRRVAIVVTDPLDRSDPYRFVQSVTFDLGPPLTAHPVPRPGHPAPRGDVPYALTALDLVPEGEGVSLLIENRGPGSSPAGARSVRILVGDDPEPRRALLNLPILNPSETALISLYPTVRRPSEPTWIEAAIEPWSTDYDTTRLRTRAQVPRRSMVVYDFLMLGLARDIVWRTDATTRLAWPDWPPDMRDALRNRIEMLYSGEGIRRLLDRSIPRPRPLGDPAEFGAISSADALTIFLDSVAVSLWVEVERVVPWSVLSVPRGQRPYLFDSWYIIGRPEPSTYRVVPMHTVQGYVLPWNPLLTLRFLEINDLIRSSRRETAFRLTDWMRGVLVHFPGSAGTISDETNLRMWWGHTGFPAIDRMLYRVPGQPNYTAGCWGTSGLYAAMLRTLNIPVSVESQPFGSRHRRPVIHGDWLTMHHGDDPYNRNFLPSSGATGGIMASDEVFQSVSQYEARYVTPYTGIAEADLENERRTIDRAAYSYADGLLSTAILEGVPEEFLPRSRADAEAEFNGIFIRLFSLARARALTDLMIAEVERQGGGDFLRGAMTIRRRYLAEFLSYSEPSVRGWVSRWSTPP